MGERVLVALPGSTAPFAYASEVEVSGPSEGRIALAGGYGSHGEPVRRVRGASGAITELWLSGTRLIAEDELAAEMLSRYGDGAAAERRPRKPASRRTAP